MTGDHMADDRDGLTAALAALQPEIRAMLAEDLPVDRQRCEEAFAAKRWGQLREQVHRVKGSASFCHLEALRDACAVIEQKVAADTPPDISDMEHFTREIDAVLAAL